MRKIRPQSVPVRNETVSWREFGTEGILFNPDSSHYSQLNEVGLMIWKQVDGRRSIQDIAAELAARFDADAEVVAQDTQEFIEDLVNKELLTVGPGPA